MDRIQNNGLSYILSRSLGLRRTHGILLSVLTTTRARVPENRTRHDGPTVRVLLHEVAAGERISTPGLERTHDPSKSGKSATPKEDRNNGMNAVIFRSPLWKGNANSPRVEQCTMTTGLLNQYAKSDRPESSDSPVLSI